MKICPVCQASFADGFQYCPQDASVLTKYDLRADLRNARALRFTLPEPDALIIRLARELKAAAIDLHHDPRGFLRDLLRGEGPDLRRRQALLAGVALAAVMLPAVLFKFNRAAPGPGPMPQATPEFRIIKLTSPHLRPEGEERFTGGSQANPQRAGGGGGGGRRQPAPPSRGHLPLATLQPQIVMPNPEPPKIARPLLPVVMTVQVDPRALPLFTGGPVGLPGGAIGPLSSGPGEGDGIGTGHGTGIGPGHGSGFGLGLGFNTSGNRPQLGGGGGDPPLAGTNGAGRPTIIYKERARYTEEARQNKVQGTVMLSAFFTADGRVTNIRVLRGLPDGLTEMAIEAAQRIRFHPATRNGAPITVRANLEYHFTLY